MKQNHQRPSSAVKYSFQNAKKNINSFREALLISFKILKLLYFNVILFIKIIIFVETIQIVTMNKQKIKKYHKFEHFAERNTILR